MSLADEMAAHGVEQHPFFVGEGFSKLFKMPAGTEIGQHAHATAHDSILLLGCVTLVRNGLAIELIAPAIVHMPAHIAHSIQAVTPALWACNWPNTAGLTEAELEQRVIE